MKAVNKKKIKVLCLELLMVFFMAGMLLGPAMKTEAAAKYTITRADKSKTFTGKGKCKAKVYFDRVVLKGKSSAVKKINKQIKKESSRFLKEVQRSSIYSDAKMYAECYAEDIEFYYYAKSKVTYNKKNIISIQIETEFFGGGVSNSDRYGLTFNLKNGKLLKLTDVCKGSASSIKKKIVKKAKKQYDIVQNPYGISTIQDYKTKDFKFYLNKKGKAVVCFAPYEVSYGGWYREIVVPSKY